MAGRWVIHLDLDAFFASVEQLTRPTLRGRPVLVGGLGGRGVVAGASYEARERGARSAMPMHQAARLIEPHGVVVPPRGAVYGLASRRVFAVLGARIPVLEMLSFDEAFGEPEELVGASAATVLDYVESLRAEILAETGLTASVGVGPGKQVAKIASGLAKPDGSLVISAQDRAAMLDHLSVRKLWGIGPVAGERLAKLGIDTIGQFAALSDAEVISAMGPTHGPAMRLIAAGVDDRPVAMREGGSKQISSERTYASDITAAAGLRAALLETFGHTYRRFQADGRLARTVTVKLKLSDMSIISRSQTLGSPTVDREPLWAAALRLLSDPEEIGAIRLVGVGLSGFTDFEQIPLFSDAELDGGPPDEAAVLEASPFASGAPQTSSSQTSSSRGGSQSELPEPGSASGNNQSAAPIAARDRAAQAHRWPSWRPGDDVTHPEFGHGWVQGAGHGKVTVRFETRASGPGRARNLVWDDPLLAPADPRISLDWDLSEEHEFDD